MKKALITGVTGQDGSYLAEFLLSKGYEVHGIIRRASTFNTQRIDHIYVDPHTKGAKFFLHYGDLSDGEQITNIIYNLKPDEIYHLGAQSHVRVSFDIPEYTGNVTALGTTRILEAVRKSGIKTKFYQASSSEMFGSAAPPQNEETPFKPQSPYAAAKLYAYWLVKNYREGYGIFASNGILFNHECVTAGTPIIIKQENLIDIVPIEEVVPHRENPEKGKRYVTLNCDLEIWNGDKWTRVKSMTATWNKSNSREDKKVKRIVCRGGFYEATHDHISFLKGGKEIKTGELKEGDKLELKSFPELSSKTILSLEEAEFLGMIVADGYVRPEGKGRFINNDVKLRNRFSTLWEKVSGGWSQTAKHGSGFNPKNTVYSLELRGGANYLKYISREIYTEKKFKRIPKRILNASTECIKAFLRGYNNCDGLKKGNQKTEFKSFTTNSQVLAAGLWLLVNKTLKLRVTFHPEMREDKVYYHLNINSNIKSGKGKHLKKPLEEIKKANLLMHTGWLFDLETESGTFSAGIGLTWIHNSPRRGETFVTRKITRAIANIIAGRQKKLYLGNMEAKRDWGFAPEYCEAMWRILQQGNPDDFVVGTGDSRSVREFVEKAFDYAGLEIEWKGSGEKEKGFVKSLKKGREETLKPGDVIIEIDPKYFRPTEVDNLKADISKAKRIFNWSPRVSFAELVKIMVDYDMKTAGLVPAGEGIAVSKKKGFGYTEHRVSFNSRNEE